MNHTQNEYNSSLGVKNNANLSFDSIGIMAMILSLFGLYIVGIIMGHISLNKIKQGKAKGEVFAIIALVLGYYSVFLIFLVTIALIVFIVIFNEELSLLYYWSLD